MQAQPQQGQTLQQLGETLKVLTQAFLNNDTPQPTKFLNPEVSSFLAGSVRGNLRDGGVDPLEFEPEGVKEA